MGCVCAVAVRWCCSSVSEPRPKNCAQEVEKHTHFNKPFLSMDKFHGFMGCVCVVAILWRCSSVSEYRTKKCEM